MNKSFFTIKSEDLKLKLEKRLILIKEKRAEHLENAYQAYHLKPGDKIGWFKRQKTEETREEMKVRAGKEFSLHNSDWQLDYLSGFDMHYEENRKLALSLLKACEASETINITVEDYNKLV